MKSVFIVLGGFLWLCFFGIPESCDALAISGIGAWGSFQGTVTYRFHPEDNDATLEVVLTNTSSLANGGYITGFVFNNPGGRIGTVTFSGANFELLGAPHFDSDVNAMPMGYFDIGAALRRNWQDGGDPRKGIGVGVTRTYVFTLGGERLDELDEMGFKNELSVGGAHFFVARFRGFENGESDKVPAGDPLPVTLSSFSATNHGGSIEISWSSHTEIDVLAYHLYRSEIQNGHFSLVARLKAYGNSEIPRSYRYVDRDVVAGRTYYYRLAQENHRGDLEFFGPVLAAVCASVPATFRLFPNYPNPFNSSTAVKYQVPEAGHVVVVIYDVLGREVRNLVDGHHMEGSYTILWDGQNDRSKDLESGVYWCVLKFRDFTDTIKMILIR